MNEAMELHTTIHREDGQYWADVAELPGCFATGDTLDELFESLRESVRFYLDDASEHPMELAGATLTDALPL